MKHKKVVYDELKDDKPRHAHCSFCGGKGKNMQAENVVDALGKRYRVPVSHEQCKASILSTPLMFSL